MPDTTNRSTEEKILAAATEVFLQKGFSGARMQEIADRAEINKAMLHYYFRSKEKLFRVILTEAMQKMTPLLVGSLGGDAPVVDKLVRLVNEHINFLLKNPHLPIFVMHELGQNQGQFMKELMGKTNKGETVLTFVQQVIEEGQSGTIRVVNPIHLMLNVQSMIIFPFVARSMIGNMVQMSPVTVTEILEERREAVVDFVRAALRP